MRQIKTEFLFTIALEVEVSNLGDTPYGSLARWTVQYR